jgi:hypothetical protein
VGAAINASGQLQAVEWEFGSALCLQPDSFASNAFSINDSGWVAGVVSTDNFRADNVPVVWRDNETQQLNLPAGAVGGEAVHINNNDQVLCLAYFPVPGTDSAVRQQYYIWDSGNTTLLAFPGNKIPTFPDDFATQAEDMNDSGIVVGTSDDRAVMWINGVVTDLNTLIYPNSGWTLIDADSINDAGDIVGTGEYDGQNVPFLLTPEGDVSIPEPTGFCLAAGWWLSIVRPRVKKYFI